MYKKVSRDNGPEHIGRHYRSQSGNPAESRFAVMSLTAVYVRFRPIADSHGRKNGAQKNMRQFSKTTRP